MIQEALSPGYLNPLMAALFCCVCADPGSGLLYDNVLSGSESGDLLRLVIDPSTLRRTRIATHRRGTDIGPPFSPHSSLPSSPPAPPPSPDRLFSPAVVLSVAAAL